MVNAANPAFHTYTAFGMQIASELALPGVFSVPATSDRPVDLALRYRDIPAICGERPANWFAITASNADSPDALQEVTIDFRGIARFRIRGTREIGIHPCPGVSAALTRAHLLGSAMGVLLHQRRLLPLHSSAVVAKGRVVAFAGRPGIGKSSLVAYFHARGYEVVCDDICALTLDDQGKPHAWPGLRHLKLCPDAAEYFGYAHSTPENNTSILDKCHVRLGNFVMPRPIPLDRVYVLQYSNPANPPGITRQTNREAAESIMSHTYRHGLLRTLGLARENFLQATMIAVRTPVFTVARQSGFELFESQSQILEDHIINSINMHGDYERHACQEAL